MLCGFVVAQPVLDAFGRAGETIVFRNVDRVGVVFFAAVVVLVPPLVLWALEYVVVAVNDSAGVVAHDVLTGGLWILLAIEVLGQVDRLGTVGVLVGGVLLGTTVVVCSIRWKELRLWVLFATPAPLVFALIFLLVSPVSAQVTRSENVPAKQVTVGRPAPVVMLMLDELPLRSVVDADGQLDAELFPHLAALQQDTDVFLNASSNAWATTYSVPSMLTGQLPQGRTIPVATSHPDNAFTLLARSHELRVHELLGLCPESLCPRPDRVRPAAARDGRAPAGRRGGVLADHPAGHRGGGPGRCAVRGGQRRDEAGVRVGAATARRLPSCSHHRASWTSSTTSTDRAPTAGRRSTSCTC